MSKPLPSKPAPTKPAPTKPAAAAPAKPAPSKPAPAAPAKTAPVPKDRASNGVAKPATPAPAAKPAPAKAPAARTAPAAPAPAPTKKVKITAPVEAEVEIPAEDDTTVQDDYSDDSPEAAAAEAEVEQEPEFQEEAEEVAEGEQGELEASADTDDEAAAQTFDEEPAAEEVLEPEVEAPTPPKPARTMSGKLAPAPAPAPKAAPKPAPAPQRGLPSTQKSRQLANANPQPGSPKTIAGDINVSRILLAQDTSKLVKARKAFAGQIVVSPEGTIIGGIANPGEPAQEFFIVPLLYTTGWSVREAEGFGWVRNEPRTPENDHLPWQFFDEAEGRDLKRVKTIELVCLLVSDLEAAMKGITLDEDGIPENLDEALLLPKAIGFSSTGFNAGKTIATHFAKVEGAKKFGSQAEACDFMLPVGCVMESGEEDTSWYVPTVGGAQKLPKEYRALAREWYDKLKGAQFNIVDEGEAEAQAGEHMEARPAQKPGRQGKF